jgi:hypothetical protein
LVRKVHAKLGPRKVWLLKRLTPLKKPSALTQDNREDALRASQELARTHPSKV